MADFLRFGHNATPPAHGASAFVADAPGAPATPADVGPLARSLAAPAATSAIDGATARSGEDGGIAQIDRRVIQLFALVGEAIAGSTSVLLTGDRTAARSLVQRDADIDALYRELDREVLAMLAEQRRPEEMTQLVAVLRILPELERSGDLAEHVARRASRGITTDMTARARGLIEQMGEVACAMWRMAADAYGERAASALELDSLDDELDELHVSLTAELGAGSMAVPIVIELVLVARFYERLGDHAVNIARRVPLRPAGHAAAGAAAGGDRVAGGPSQLVPLGPAPTTTRLA